MARAKSGAKKGASKKAAPKRKAAGKKAAAKAAKKTAKTAKKTAKATKKAAKKPAKAAKKPAKAAKKPAKAAKKPAKAAKKAAKKTATATKKAAKKTATATKKAAKKTAKATKKAAKKTAKATKKAARANAKALSQRQADVARADPSLFAPLTHGERADAIRVLTEDRRVSEMAKVGRYRVISVEPHTVKPPEPLSGRRLARIVVYDYAGDRCVDAVVDLDKSMVAHIKTSRSQPMLAREEEAAAISIAMADERVSAELSLGDEPQVAMHYWSDKDTDLAFSRRSAAVIFGRPGSRPSVVAVVDLIDAHVAEVVPAAQW